jgi:hypothetical protein
MKLTAWNAVLLEKLIVTQLVEKFSAFYGTRRFITELTRAHQFQEPAQHFLTAGFEGEESLATRPTLS